MCKKNYLIEQLLLRNEVKVWFNEKHNTWYCQNDKAEIFSKEKAESIVNSVFTDKSRIKIVETEVE